MFAIRKNCLIADAIQLFYVWGYPIKTVWHIVYPQRMVRIQGERGDDRRLFDIANNGGQASDNRFEVRLSAYSDELVGCNRPFSFQSVSSGSGDDIREAPLGLSCPIERELELVMIMSCEGQNDDFDVEAIRTDKIESTMIARSKISFITFIFIRFQL